MFKALILEQDDTGKNHFPNKRDRRRFSGHARRGSGARGICRCELQGRALHQWIGGLFAIFRVFQGVEFAGEVTESRDEHYQPGEKVIATGWRVGEVSHGGYAELARIKADYLVGMPKGMTTRQAMIAARLLLLCLR